MNCAIFLVCCHRRRQEICFDRKPRFLETGGTYRFLINSKDFDWARQDKPSRSGRSLLNLSSFLPGGPVDCALHSLTSRQEIGQRLPRLHETATLLWGPGMKPPPIGRTYSEWVCWLGASLRSDGGRKHWMFGVCDSGWRDKLVIVSNQVGSSYPIRSGGPMVGHRFPVPEVAGSSPVSIVSFFAHSAFAISLAFQSCQYTIYFISLFPTAGTIQSLIRLLSFLDPPGSRSASLGLCGVCLLRTPNIMMSSNGLRPVK